MNWQQLLALGIVLAVAGIFIWRSADPNKHKHGCNCGCEPEADEKSPGKKV
jgi:hypothetical protein